MSLAHIADSMMRPNWVHVDYCERATWHSLFEELDMIAWVTGGRVCDSNCDCDMPLDDPLRKTRAKPRLDRSRGKSGQRKGRAFSKRQRSKHIRRMHKNPSTPTRIGFRGYDS